MVCHGRPLAPREANRGTTKAERDGATAARGGRCSFNDGELEELRRRLGRARLRVPEFIRQRVLGRRLQTGSPQRLRAAE